MSYNIVTDFNKLHHYWSSFLSEKLENNIFQSLEFYQSQKGNFGIEPFVYGVIKDQILVGLLSGVILSNGGRLGQLFTSRAIITGGPIITSDNSINKKVLELILNTVKKNLQKKVIYIQFRNLWDCTLEKEIFEKNGFVFEDHLDILIDLTSTEAELWERMTKDRKKSIRKGQRELKVELLNGNINNINNTYNLLKLVYDRVKLPLPGKEYFVTVIKELYKKGMLKIFGAFKDDKLIGVRLVLCYNKLIYDWYAGANDDYLEYRPNDILIWEVIKWGKSNNYSTFDFGGAGKPNVDYGVRNYKMKFGGNLVNHGRFEIVNNTFLMFIGKTAVGFIKRYNDLLKKKNKK